MPVYEIRYTAYEAPMEGAFRRWLAIPRYSLMAVSGKLLAWTLFGVGSMMLLGTVVFLVVVNNPAILAMLRIRDADVMIVAPGKIFETFLAVQLMVSMASLMIASPSMIARERQHNALALVYARPVTRLAYLSGKAAAIFALLAYLTALQSIVIFIVMMATNPVDGPFWESFWTESLPIFLKAMTASIGCSLVLTLVATMASACTKNARFAAVVLLILVFGSSGLAGFLSAATWDQMLALGVVPLLQQFVQALLVPGSDVLLSWPAIMMGLVVWTVVPAFIAALCVRPVDIHRE